MTYEVTPAARPDRDAVLKALDAVKDPKSGQGLVAAGLVHGLSLGERRAGFMLEIAPADAHLYARVRDEAEAALLAVPGVDKAQVVLTAEQATGAPPSPAPGVTRVQRGTRLSDDAQAQSRPQPPQGAMRPDHVAQVVAVASGKGGVGKSTVAVNLACALARLGYRVGLLDADVYGPSAPKMLGLEEAEPKVGPERKLVPLEAWGIKAISIGFLVDEGQAMIWRGPMASSAVNQLLGDVAWGTEAEPLDVLIVDMPPGTGDIQLTMVQRVALAGAVLVSTPQEVALIDVRRGAAMFEKTATPILGVVENMSYFADSSGAQIPIFGHGGARRTAEELGAPFLGEVPIEVALREACDEGKPVVAAAPESASAKAFMDIAANLAERLKGAREKPAPAIVFD